MKHSTIISAAALFAIVAGIGIAQNPSAATTTVTAATGTIAQLNYDPGGNVQGFLVGTNILLSFPASTCGGLSALGVVGNSVTYSGTESTATSGFESVLITSFTNNTTNCQRKLLYLRSHFRYCQTA